MQKITCARGWSPFTARQLLVHVEVLGRAPQRWMQVLYNVRLSKSIKPLSSAQMDPFVFTDDGSGGLASDTVGHGFDGMSDLLGCRVGDLHIGTATFLKQATRALLEHTSIVSYSQGLD